MSVENVAHCYAKKANVLTAVPSTYDAIAAQFLINEDWDCRGL